MTDIVERLRDGTTRWMALSEPDPLRQEAADEIERLRNVREQLRAVQALVAELRAVIRKAGILR